MTCPECTAKMAVTKTAVMGDRTLRLCECPCGVRCQTEERITRRLPVSTNGRICPPVAANGRGQPPNDRPQPPGNPGGVGGGLSPFRSDSESGSLSDLRLDHSQESDRPRARRRKQVEYSVEFQTFWTAYPNKTGKGEAARVWERDKPPLPAILSALFWQAKSHNWTKEGGKFVPLPATYLNQRRWEDSPASVTPAPPTPYCDWHRFGNRERRARNPLPNCPECKHVAALNRPAVERQPSPASTADVLAAQLRFIEEKQQDQRKQGVG